MAKNIIVCDFDGTVNRFDVGSRILKTYLPDKWEKINNDYKEGKLTNLKIYKDVFLPLMQKKGKEITGSIDRFLQPNKGFGDFYNFCRERNLEIVILSDGFDFYIKRFLEKYGFSVKFFANSVIANNNENYQLKLPYYSEHCDDCGTCKSLILKSILNSNGEAIYVGDGQSDICPSSLPDVFFGKRKLLNKINKIEREREVADFYFYDFTYLKSLFERVGKFRAVIFDLDGTIVDGFDIIYESFNYALEKLGLEKVPERKIKRVIGPALSEGFRSLVPKHLVEEGVSLYRSYYKERYLGRNKLFNGIKELLQSLKMRDIIVGLITNKKAPFAIELINYMSLSKYFDFIIGADQGMLPKPDSMMMDEVVKRYDIEKSQVIYIGDSEIDGAFSQSSEVNFIAVGMGLGKESSLYRYKPIAYCKDVQQLTRVISYLIPKNG